MASEDNATLAQILETTQRTMQAMQKLLTTYDQRLSKVETRQETEETSIIIPSNTRLIGDLEKRLPEFSFNPDTDISFSDWYARYEHIFIADGAQLDDKSRLRLLTEKLAPETYRRFASHVLPKAPNELKFDEAVKVLKNLFEIPISVFKRQYDCWSSSFDKDPLEDDQTYADRINERFYKVMNKMDVEDLKVLRFLVGLKGKDDQIHLPYLLSFADKTKEAEEPLTLQGIVKELTKQRTFKRDGQLIAKASATSEINYVGEEVNEHKNKDIECYRCGKHGHMRKDCRSELPDCKGCNGTGKDKGGNSLEQAYRRKGKPQFKRRHQIGFLAEQQEGDRHTEFHGRRLVDIKINEVPLSFCVDTGSDVTLMNIQTWERIGSPKTRPPKCRLITVSGSEIPCNGKIQCEFEFDSEKHKGIAYVTDAPDLFGLDWIAKTKKGREMLDLLGFPKVTKVSNYNKTERSSADLGEKSNRSKVPGKAGTAHRIGYIKALKLQRCNYNAKKGGQDIGDKPESGITNHVEGKSRGLMSQESTEMTRAPFPIKYTDNSQFRREGVRERNRRVDRQNGNSLQVGETIKFQNNSATRKWLQAEVVATKGKGQLIIKLKGEARLDRKHRKVDRHRHEDRTDDQRHDHGRKTYLLDKVSCLPPLKEERNRPRRKKSNDKKKEEPQTEVQRLGLANP